MSLLPSALVLGALAMAALALTRARPLPPRGSPASRAAARALGVAALVQGVHFAEEAATGFHARFPALFGLPALPFGIFAGFNLAWLAIWTASLPGLRTGWPGALFAAWFLALAGMLNGVAHPLLAAAVRGYFPGLATSPLVAAAGGLLWIRLRRATEAIRPLEAPR